MDKDGGQAFPLAYPAELAGFPTKGMTLRDWRAGPESDAICAEKVMGWRRVTRDGEPYWEDTNGAYVSSAAWSPTSDRNATAMLLEEIERRELQDAFDHELGVQNADSYAAARWGCGDAGSPLGILRIDPSLIAYCCVAAREGDK